ncbi:MAG: hypothetical protein LBR16_04335 [Treponema sp.]|jgi:hypothetical protein|nr:hypothetical protein [Treponema sp.]
MTRALYRNAARSLACALTLACAIALGLFAAAGTAGAQTLNEDDTTIPLTEDLSKMAGTGGGDQSSKNEASLKMGLWIETVSNNTFLIRDMDKHEKSGFEHDHSAIYSEANWWFWGDLSPSFHLDAEVGVWELDHTLYQANSWGDADPDTSWRDGFSRLGGIFFAPLYGLNDVTPGVFNKGAITLKSPVLNARAGYGLLKNNSMTGFTGIFNMIDPWDDVGKGFLELSLGEGAKRAGGNVSFDALAALSRMREQYGIYSFFKTSLFEKADIALTFTSTSKSTEFADYADQNDNTASLYAAWRPTEPLTLSVHGMGTFGTERDLSKRSLAGAVRAAFKAGVYAGELSASLAGSEARSLWGDDDTVNPGALVTSLDQTVTLGPALIALDADWALNEADAEAGVLSLDEGLWNLRWQPRFEYDFAEKTGLPIKTGVYGVFNTNRIGKATDSEQPWTTNAEEAGIEVTLSDVPGLKKLVFDYALKIENKAWTHAYGYEWDTIYHSFMLSCEMTDALSATAASVLRQKSDADPTLVPFGAAAGVSYKTGVKALGSPQVWCHFVYGMDPYEDVNYSLYRLDDPLNRPTHTTYLLNSLYENVYQSRISVGLIWDLQ